MFTYHCERYIFDSLNYVVFFLRVLRFSWQAAHLTADRLTSAEACLKLC